MSRVEENEKMIVHFAKNAMETGNGTYEEMVAWHLGAMNSFLSDISKSLAMIADKMASPTGAESEGKGMKRAFTMHVEDGVKIVGLQIGVAVQRETDGEKGVTFFALSDDIRENDEWLFKVSGKAERIAAGEPTDAESEDKG